MVELIMWHYWADGRTYNGTKTEVSSDGITWYTVFDSAIDGTYVETSTGHSILLIPDKCEIYNSNNIITKSINECL